MKPCFPGNGWAHLLMGSSEWIPYFTLFVHAAFALLLSLLNSIYFILQVFTLLILSPIPLYWQ